jgi:hypothetical protein
MAPKKGAIDLDKELALAGRERFNRACPLQLHPIYMWRGPRSLPRCDSRIDIAHR